MSKFVGNDLTYDGQYASFTVTSFCGYAVTGVAFPIPEPGTLGLLLAAAAAVGWAKRRRMTDKG